MPRVLSYRHQLNTKSQLQYLYRIPYPANYPATTVCPANVHSGSLPTIPACSVEVRFAPESGHGADIGRRSAMSPGVTFPARQDAYLYGSIAIRFPPLPVKIGVREVACRKRNRSSVMKIGEFLTHAHQRLVTCLPDDLLNAVAKLMYAHNIGAMPVCELGTRMVGVISERDLVRSFARTDLSEMQYIRARDIMTTRVLSCQPDDSMRSAQESMKLHHIRHLPIVKDGRVLGMLSMRDTLVLCLQESEDETSVLRDMVAAARAQ